MIIEDTNNIFLSINPQIFSLLKNGLWNMWSCAALSWIDVPVVDLNAVKTTHL